MDNRFFKAFFLLALSPQAGVDGSVNDRRKATKDSGTEWKSSKP